MFQEMAQNVLQWEKFRAVVDNGQHVYAKSDLHIGILVQIVQQNLGMFIPFQIYGHPHTLPVRLIPDVPYPLNPFLFDQFSNPFQ